MKTKIITILLMSLIFATGSGYAQSQQDNNFNQTLSEMDQSPLQNDSKPVFTHGIRRDLNPLQIQLVHTFGPATPSSFAPGGGLHLGYQFSRLIYIGLTSSAFVDGENAWDKNRNFKYNDDKEYDQEVFGQDGAEHFDSELNPIHLLEMRVTPWDFGFYFSLGAMYRGEQTSTTEFKSEHRTIGDNDYTTGLTATVEYEEWYGATTGIGFNYIFQCGFTLGTGMSIGLNAQTPEVTVSSTDLVSEEDLNHWKDQIEYNEKQLPYLFTFSIGYAF